MTNRPPDPFNPHPVELNDEVRGMLNKVATATITGHLQGRGIRNVFLSGLKPTRPDLRLLGYALTLRYVPLREDRQKELAGGINPQRQASEYCGPDDIIIMEARNIPDAGTIGDIFALRAQRRGAAGVITDGALRDTPAIAKMDFPAYHQASHAATWGRHHMPLACNIPIACAGVTVFPGDILVGDGEGVVVIPPAIVEEVARACYAQELEEEFALERVDAGESTIGLFPLSQDRRPEFETWLASHSS
jgi:5-oxopent-3-ene-1,2,5-tricarboxylate decarboxylase/2-hydroxyhepta-2,4-diene-1,7-dioate isomerase